MTPYRGRTLPLTILAGKHGAAAPLNVENQRNGRILLSGRRRLLDTFKFRREIPFIDQGRPWENEDLYSKLVELNYYGIPFQYQPKEMESPDILMAWWQEIGKLKVSFKEISWRNQNEWFITIVEPPVIGVGGWTGPKPFGK
ncbi:hypothetical protein [Methylobrevis albus]|uniref:Uncharacterized protein n=1 Tax=Methylobrevis albus TaxID=2793297 RepID=A0A931N076_9HYPH|nr:hypothetical protein [Methylobrevis albus]MBH0238496.1 hypothetical protein [Methylobrevis albus]